MRAPTAPERSREPLPRFAGFYRWHVLDPVVFRARLRVTTQQIGMNLFAEGAEAARDAYVETNPLAGTGWFPKLPGVAGMGIFERVDDCCATAFVYCRDVQAVRRVEVAAACADLTRCEFEQPDPMEGAFG